MYILVKNIDGEMIIVGSAGKKIAVDAEDVTVYKIPDHEYTPGMINSKLDYYEEDVD